MRKVRIPRAEVTERRDIIPEASAEETVDSMLESTPPGEIGDGALPAPKGFTPKSFGSFPRSVYVRHDAGRVVRPPDKRTRVEPAPANIQPRTGGPVFL